MNFFFLFLLPAVCFTTISTQDDNENGPEGRLVRFHRPRPTEGQECQVDNHPGVCLRRSRCNLPSGKLCRGGLFPVICCVKERRPTEPIPTTPKFIKTTPKPIRTTPKPIRTTPKPFKATTTKMEEINEVDIVFPGCGSRSPKVPGSTEPPKRELNSGRGRQRGLGRRNRGKRSVRREELRRKRRGIRPVIVGGVTAKAYSWPWMVAVFKKRGTEPSFLCGASLISKNYVLTAAHCFTTAETKDPSKFSVSVGAHNTKDGTTYNVDSIRVHPQYKSGQYYYDICLLKIKEQVTLNDKVYPVCLPSDSLRSRIGSTKKNVTITGWGDTSFGGRSSKVLQEVELPVVPLRVCNESYYKIARTSFPEGINQLFICAGLEEGGKDSCQGDSGGPLVMEMDDSNYVQLGIVSFGMGCAQAGFPGVYTRVSKLSKWIADNTDLGKN